MFDLITRIKATGRPLVGDLEFLNHWEYFSNCRSPASFIS
jgi:hypothetical protein